MIILPAIDLYDKKAVRLYKGDYEKMTVYSENPLEIARDFERKGAGYIHMVDLEGAKSGTTPNLCVVKTVADQTSLFVEIGGGIRDMETAKKYFDAGVDRVILGTAAVEDEDFLDKALCEFGDKIAVGADVKDGYIAVKGWMEKSRYTLSDFMAKMQQKGVKNIICTDISKDGTLKGANVELYEKLSEINNVKIIASGGVSDIEDIKKLKKTGVSGVIIGKAYYVGQIHLKEALEAAK